MYWAPWQRWQGVPVQCTLRAATVEIVLLPSALAHISYTQKYGIPGDHIACWHPLGPHISYTCQWDCYLQTHQNHKEFEPLVMNSAVFFKVLYNPLSGLWWATGSSERHTISQGIHFLSWILFLKSRSVKIYMVMINTHFSWGYGA
jgi:hypothetical protein